jgi:ssDNA-binding Zn-finger/Zn-ribbon topoisomerase 1
MSVSKRVLEDLFETKLTDPPKNAAEDISLRDESLGLGFPNESHDLVCPECKSSMKLRRSKHGLFYGCVRYPACKTTHGAHNDGRPKGIPGDKQTRKARIFAHRVFDRLWKVERGEAPRMTRGQAYGWMRKVMKLKNADAHIGTFTVDQCNALVRHVFKKYPNVRTAWDKLAGDEDIF